MFVNRSSKFGKNRKNLSLNQILFLITILQVYDVLAETDLLETTTTNGITTTTNGTTCKERWTCSSCTEPTMSPVCSWFVAEQVCADNPAVQVQGLMVVTNGSSCPKFSVNHRVSAGDGNETITVVQVDDRDLGGGLVSLLGNSTVVCQPGNYTAKVDGNRISCSWASTRTPQNNTQCRRSVPHYSHLSIVFDGKLLRFDNVSDHYVTTYPGDGDCPKMECPHCHWNNGTHRYYCSWCSEYNTSVTYCDVRNISSLLYLSSASLRDDERCSGKASGVINYSAVTPGLILQSDQTPEVGCSQEDNDSSPVPPTVADGQVFGGIQSGGTTLRVHGQHFCGLRNVTCCVRNKYSCSNCDVRNDTLMVCRSPKLNFDLSNTRTIQPLQFYAQNSTVNKVAKLNLTLIKYHRYQDPVFTDFVVDGCCNVTVNGLYPDQGLAAEDLSIVLVAENSSSRCSQITFVDNTQIVCKVSQSSSPQLGPLPKQINVTIGDNLKVVKLPKQKSSHLKSPLTGILPGVITISAYVSFIAVLCVALVFFKASKDYDLSHLHGRQQLAEMRPLDERNPNDYDDSGEPENMLLVRDECH